MIFKKTAGCIIFITLATLLSSFYYVKRETSNQIEIKKNYKTLLEELNQANNTFLSILNSTTFNKKQTLKSYHQLRKTYKKSSFLSSYLENSYTLKKINGAPLPHLEPKVPEIHVLEPKGFQVLDELLNEESINLNEAKKIANDLNKDLKFLIHNQSKLTISSRQLLEALRFGLIEITTLGITGFDTPGSLSGVKETYSVFLGMNEIIKNTSIGKTPFNQLLQKELKRRKLIKSDFESFDRYTFIKETINPLYKSVVEHHKESTIPFYEEVFQTQSPINYQALSIFDDDFLNKNYYTSLSKDVMNEDLVTLGKYLFYDPILSENNRTSCSSCHSPSKAFTDGFALGKSGTSNQELKRNSPSLLNAVYSDKFFYDLRASELTSQFEHVILNKEEFNTSYVNIINRLNKSSEYKEHFVKSFSGTLKGKINTETISRSLEAYVLSLTALDSKFDESMRGNEELSSKEINGFNLFTGKATCATCHFLPTFSGNVPPIFKESESEVLGVPEDKAYSKIDDDLGRMESGIVAENAHIYKNSFKTVSVRNTELTAPYMHNGVFTTMDEVMDFYNNGGGLGHGLQVENQTLSGDSLGLSKEEINDLILFMNSLTSRKKFFPPNKLPEIDEDLFLNSRSIGSVR